MQSLIERGFRIYDFLLGEDDYKERWGGQRYPPRGLLFREAQEQRPQGDGGSKARESDDRLVAAAVRLSRCGPSRKKKTAKSVIPK